MTRMLIITTDKSNAVNLRALLERLRIEFEIAIGEEIGRTILSERFMNLILLDAAAIKGGTAWVFPFLRTRRLRIPVLVVGAEPGALNDRAVDSDLVRFVPPPIDQAKLEAAIAAAETWRPKTCWEPTSVGSFPVAPLSTYSDE